MVSVKESEDAGAAKTPKECKQDTGKQHGTDGSPTQQKEQEQDFKAKVIARSAVSASLPAKTTSIFLSNLDRVVNPTFISVIHYYEDAITDELSFRDITKALKESLAETLVEFYPLAGRLQLREDGKLDLCCSNRGAVWIEAVVDTNLKNVGGPRPNHLLSGLPTARVGNAPSSLRDQLCDMSVLIIQVTKFKCGAIAIATSWHHTIADGFSGMHFMRSWSEVALGKPISLKPVHNREVLRARGPPYPMQVAGYTTRSIDWEDHKSLAVNVSHETKLEAFHLDATAIADLKRQANVVPHDSYTSAESICAHLWRQMTKARAAANSYDTNLAKSQTTKFFMAVDGRKRLQLPSGYFGNVVYNACAVAKEADILNNPISYAACMIRNVTRNVTTESFRTLMNWVELQGSVKPKSEQVNSLGCDATATFWTSFPMYDIEFGWGRPVYAARNSPARPLIDGIAIMPTSNGKGMTAHLNVQSDRCQS